MEIIDGPRVELREQRPTVGIRRTTPFRGMLAKRDTLLAELIEWLDAHDIDPSGPFFLRLHSVDMAGDMDIEVGVIASATADGSVTAGSIPAGRYAVLAYRDHSIRANRLLQAWAAEEGLQFDVEPAAAGDHWAARVESYLTDPRTEPRKTRWVTELAFRVR